MLICVSQSEEFSVEASLHDAVEVVLQGHRTTSVAHETIARCDRSVTSLAIFAGVVETSTL